MDVNQLYIFNKDGKILLNKKFIKNDVENFTNDIIHFIEILNSSNVPVKNYRNKQLVSIFRNDIFYILLTEKDFCPIYAVEILQRFYELICKFLKSSDEVEIFSNILLIHDLLDQYMENGILQLENFCQMNPINNDLNKSTKFDNNNLNSAFLSSDSEITCDLFIDVVENLSVIVNENDSLLQFNLIGQIICKSEYFKYLSDLQITFNDVEMSSDYAFGFDKRVLLKRISFGKLVHSELFSKEKIISFHLNEPKVILMTYNAADILHNLPIRIFTKIEEANKLILLELTLRGELPSNKYMISNLNLDMHIGNEVTSAQYLASESSHPVKYSFKESKLQVFMASIKGKESVILKFKLQHKSGILFDKSNFGPINLRFEVSGFALSGICIDNFEMKSRLTKSNKWIRYVTIANTYIVNLNY